MALRAEGPREEPKTRAELVAQLLDLGVEPGGVLLVHTSFRAVRPVEGGPLGLIDALRAALGPDGTLVMPSWGDDDERPFDPLTSPAAPDLGVVAGSFWSMAGVARSHHVHAFAAAGPRADFVLQDPLPLPPHVEESPVGRVHDLDGQVLLLGVDHDADTTIHLAEVIAGVPYGLRKHCTVLRDGRPERVEYDENDHCCRRFTLVGGWLDETDGQRTGRVGHAPARLARSRAIVSVVVERLADDPLLFLHPTGAGCADCDEARASVGRSPPPPP
jgi:aminoglycoside N3'-acetyltransferase